MTHRLYLLRHAKSSWDDHAQPDHDRPLAPRGRRACGLLREHFAAEGVDPGVVVCSTALRARQTLEGVAAGFAGAPAVWHDERVYGAGADGLLGVLQELPTDFASAMLVGHNPGIHWLAESLAGEGEGLADLGRKFPTGALATLAFEGEWLRLRVGSAALENFVTPRTLSDEASG